MLNPPAIFSVHVAIKTQNCHAVFGRDRKRLGLRFILRILLTILQTGIFVTLSRRFHGRVTFERATKFFLRNQKKISEIFYPGKLLVSCVKRWVLWQNVTRCVATRIAAAFIHATFYDLRLKSDTARSLLNPWYLCFNSKMLWTNDDSKCG